MVTRVRGFDWSATELGPVASWPASLATMVEVVLGHPYPMMLWWGARAIQIYNDAAVPLLGSRHPHALGTAADQCWADAWCQIGPAVQRVAAGGGAVVLDPPAIDGNEQRASTLALTPVPDDRGGVGGVLVTMRAGRDPMRGHTPTELAARCATERQCEHLRTIFMQAPAPIAVLLGPDHVVELSNPAMASAWERTPGASWGKPAFEAVPEASRLFKPMFDRVYATGQPYIAKDLQFRSARVADGTVENRYADFVVAPLLDGEDRMQGIFIIAVDTTDHIKVRTEIHRLRVEAEAANRAKDEFLAILGHELRNPLSPITTALQIMRMQGACGRELDVIERQVGHLTRLVNDLLDVSRAMRGKIELHRRDTELAELVTEAIEVASPLLEQRRHVMDVDVPAHGLGVHVDPARLVQVVSNLLTNAAKYSDPGSRITIRGTRTDHTIRLSVRDCGAGISPEMIGRMFDPFVQQAQTIDRTRGGLGLGLSIVRSLVELHGGAVFATSEGVGCGSEFAVELPALERSTAPLPRPPDPVGAEQPSAQRRRVLVVDDNEDAAMMMGEVLERLGYQIEVAHDGPSALRIAERFHPDVAVLDIGLPVMDGYELAKRLRAQGGAPPRLVAVTGYGQPADRERGARAGFERHLVKPVDLGVLSKAVAELAR
jgi:signal transduction histidine kinase